ncbi:alkylhydroperoxidase AhpD family core domain-containing protein [Glycomyces harbinensis]|uniref:Alkylhydroperoxidase AhpD family core domain-containing protein n=1 Tax=Glycomyces harbinensis TaxID=58114 RepID=A0A1G6W605_9ACTN|nr:alkylhydroperoxidase AhpD family core domain-containing protein [Glycomyces harbinensis]
MADVYRQVESELGVIGPAITLLSPAPELLAPVWALLRESLLVGGPQERKAKEVVATVIAVRNECRFCTDAHTMMLHAAGESELAEAVRSGRTPPEWSALAEWALKPGPEGPFPAEAAARFIGTALAFELITRLVKALADDESPSAVASSRLGRQVASRLVREAVSADLAPGASLPLLEDLPGWVRDVEVREPAWAAGSPVGRAYGAVRAMAGYGSMLLSDQAADAVARTVGGGGTGLAGSAPELAGAQGLPSQAALGARLAVSAALAPGAVAESDVEEWRGDVFSDHCVVYLLTYGAMTAVDAVQDEIELECAAMERTEQKGSVDA